MVWLFGLSIVLIMAVLGPCDSQKAYKPPQPDEVMVLSEKNFTEALTSNKMLLIEYYAPWCSYCTTLKPTLQTVAEDLPNMNIDGRIAILDASAEENQGISISQRVDGYPSIVLYRDGQRHSDYLGPRTRLDILEYLRKKAGPPAIPVSSLQEIEDFITSVHSDAGMPVDFNSPHGGVDSSGQSPVNFDTDGLLAVALALFLPEVQSSNRGVYGPVCKTVLSLAGTYDQVQFLYADNLDLINFYGTEEDSLLVFTESASKPAGIISLVERETEGESMPRAITEHYLVTQILALSLAPLIPYSTATQPYINSLPVKTHVLVFHDYNERSRRILDMLLPVTSSFRGELIFITVSSSEHQLLQFFGIESGAVPELVVADMRDPFRMQRYNLRDYIEAQRGMEAAKHDGGERSAVQDLEGSVEEAVSLGQSTAEYLSKEDPITDSRVRAFLNDFQRGELRKSLFSEEKKDSDVAAILGGEKEGMPRSGVKGRKQYVKPLIGSTFREKVLGPASPLAPHEQPEKKDTFLYVHAPWCGHCKSFEPVIEDLAKLYRRDDNLQFFRIDGSRNEIDHDKVRVRGFPAFFLFPAGDKANPVEYVGERDAASLARFLKNFRKSENSQQKKRAQRAKEKREKREKQEKQEGQEK